MTGEMRLHFHLIGLAAARSIYPFNTPTIEPYSPRCNRWGGPLRCSRPGITRSWSRHWTRPLALSKFMQCSSLSVKQAFRRDPQCHESWVLKHADGSVQVEHGGYRQRGHGRTGPCQSGFAVDVKAYELVSRREVDAGAYCRLPPVTVKLVIGQAPDDPSRGHQPRPD